ncbi:aspartate kinase [Bacillus coahuilensis]|uniref:aspartate kinase n=1 Tax=Bacillus coahuilensis TaxID=408580 RepID=UPI0001850D7F|nr:aspartate kinase [Bacillus coahuilensis]
MNIIVQKFGGTSVRNEENRIAAYNHIKRAQQEGNKVVVVVSAMGRMGEPYATDTLLSLIGGANTTLSKREQDALLSCGEMISSLVFTNMLNEKGIHSTSLNGSQAGFETNADHTNAKIINMNTERLLKELEVYDVVVVAGFQGAAPNGDVTTIGRGGSDTSAAALGVALHASMIEIFTDVTGIMTADPRISEKARPLTTVTYNEVSNLAHQGAKVIHPRAVEIAMGGGVPIHIRNTNSNEQGTIITEAKKYDQGFHSERLITGIAHVTNIAQIKVSAKEDQYSLQSDVFKAMAHAGISVDFINISPKGVMYTVAEHHVQKAVASLEALGYDANVETKCAKVSVVGAGIHGVPGVTSRIVTTLSEAGISILQSADSHSTIWVLVKEELVTKAVNLLHDEFELHKD